MTALHLIVCGSNYGRAYLRAIERVPQRYRLASILARGSERSTRLAEKYGAPLYREISEVPARVSIACAAIGSEGKEVHLALLARGVHVLCEHPQTARHLRQALETAAARSVCFHINGHFVDLEAPVAFIHCAERLRPARPVYMSIAATERSLYATLDIAKRALTALRPFDLARLRQSEPFLRLQGLLGGVTTDFHLQLSPEGTIFDDGSSDYAVDFRLTFFYPRGILSLLSVSGPVVWHERYSRAIDPSRPLWSAEHFTCKSLLELGEDRISANVRALDALAENISSGRVPPHQAPEYLLEVAEAWEHIAAVSLAA